MKTIKLQKGFTLLELMIVMAIISIVSLVALPSYKAYMVRAQIEEGMMLVGGAKTSVLSYFGEVGDLPDDNDEAAFDSTTGRYVQDVRIDEQGQIVARFGLEANRVIEGSTLTLTPIEQAGGNLRWYCTSTAPNKYLPSSCTDILP